MSVAVPPFSSRRAFNRSVNPYVDRVDSVRHRILVNHEKVITPEDVSRVHEVVRRYQRTVVELGSGSGAHLVQRASSDTNGGFFGFELRFKRAFRTVQKAEKASVDNAFVLRTDSKFLPAFFQSGSLSAIYMNFPDPWDRRKWKKNRMMNKTFLEEASRLLSEDGHISYKTDHKGYFEDTVGLLRETPGFRISQSSSDLYSSDFLTENVPTEFELLFLSKKLPIYFVRIERV
jgi:tRNA (guanine-N7-)-methyltransferase